YVSVRLGRSFARVELALVVDEGGLLVERHAQKMQSATKVRSQAAQPRGSRLEVAERARFEWRHPVARAAQHALERDQQRGRGLQVGHESGDVHVVHVILLGWKRKKGRDPRTDRERAHEWQTQMTRVASGN